MITYDPLELYPRADLHLALVQHGADGLFSGHRGTDILRSISVSLPIIETEHEDRG